MFVSKVVLTNVGPFGQQRMSRSKGYKFSNGAHTFIFSHGSIGIFGTNGSGKTTLLDSVFGALTNDFNRFDGVRADLVNNQSDATKDEASIFIEVEHDGVEFTLLRSIVPARVELKLKGEKKPVVKNDEVIDRLRQIGIDRKLLEFCVFKRQPGSERNAIDDFLRTTPAARAEAYMSLNGTEHCGVIYDVLGDIVNHDKELNSQVLDNSDELVIEISRLEKEQADAQQQLDEHAGHMMLPEHRKKAIDVVKRAECLPKMLADLDALRVERDGARNLLTEAQEKLASRTKKTKAAYATMEALDAQVQTAQAAVASWDKYEKAAGRRKQLEKEFEQLEQEGKSKKKPVAPKFSSTDEEVLRQQLAMLQTNVVTAKKALKTFQGTGLMQCPICGTEVAALEDQLLAKEEFLKTASITEKELRDALEDIDSYAVDSKMYEKWHAGFQARVQANEEALAHLEQVQAPKASLKENELVIAQFNDAHDEAEKWEQRVQESKQKVTALETELKGLGKQIDKLQVEVKECAVDINVVARAKQRIQEHMHAELEYAKVQGLFNGIGYQLVNAQVSLDKLKHRLGRTKKLKRVGRILIRVRDVFHKQALPQRVAQANLGLMEGDINQNLIPFGEPFWVETDEALSFLVHKPGEPPHRAERLSGGQKVVLALAFWPAVNSLYRAGMGMMGLDEPTANLDEANILYLRKAISRLTKQVRGKRQIIIITHAEALKPSFDQVIELEKGV